jgi:hypothetical protein
MQSFKQVASRLSANARNMSRLLGALAVGIALSGCGGGNDAVGTSQAGNQANQNATQERTLIGQDSAGGGAVVKYALTTNTPGQTEIVSSTPFTEFEKSLLLASSPEQIDAILAGQSATFRRSIAAAVQGAATTAASTIPAACRMYRFIGVQGCLIVGTTLYGMPSGSSLADIAPLISGCKEIPMGGSFIGTTPAAGGASCYQFVFNQNATVNSEIRVPADFVGIAEMFSVLPNGVGLKVAASTSPTNPFAFSTTSQYYRVALVLRTSTGTGGQPVGVGIGVPAPGLPGPVNDDPSRPSAAAMNQTVSVATPSTNQSQYYYFFPTTPGQTTANLVVNFTANQTASYFPAQKSAAGVYTLGMGVTLNATDSNVVQHPSGLTPTPAGSAVQDGLMVRVASATAGAAILEPFTLRAGVTTASIANVTASNDEGFTRIYPKLSGFLQAFSRLTMVVDVKDANGAPVAGERVLFTAYNDKNDNTNAQAYTSWTDSNGRVSTTLSLPNYCPGGTVDDALVLTAPVGDHWRIEGQFAKVDVVLPDISSNTFVKRDYFKICKETYLGRY